MGYYQVIGDVFFNLWAILEFCNTFGLGLKGAYIYELAVIVSATRISK